nr:hypothetical protein CFP56_06501 [Quercus suber]
MGLGLSKFSNPETLSLYFFYIVSHVAKEWVDHTLAKSKEEESHWFAATKAQALAEKKTKETLTKLAETKKARNNTEVAMAGHKRVNPSLELRNPERVIFPLDLRNMASSSALETSSAASTS